MVSQALSVKGDFSYFMFTYIYLCTMSSKQFIERKHSKINLPVIMLGFGGILNSYNVGSE